MAAAADVAAEAWRQLDGEADLAGAHATVEVGIIRDRRFLGEVARPRDLEAVIAADRAVVAVEHGEGQVLDIHADAVAEHEQQQHAAENRERGADRIAPQLERLAPGIGEHAGRVERHAALARRCRLLRRHGRCGRRLAGRLRRIRDCLFQAGDEGLLQRRGAARRHDRRGRVRRQHLARMHQRDPVAAFGLVHEMGRDEDGDVVLAGELGEDLPEAVAGDRIDAGCRLVENEDVGPVDHGDRQRQPLPQAQGQRIGQGIGDVGEIEPADHLGDARGDGLRRQLEQARMQVEILRDRETPNRARSPATCSRCAAAPTCRRHQWCCRTAAQCPRSPAAIP